MDRGLQLLAAVAGLGGFVYAVGAAILWLRYATTGFDADEALAVASRGQIVSLGFRWVAGWGLAVVVLGAILSRARGRLRGAKPVALYVLLMCECAFVIVALTLLTWSALTVAFALLATTVFVSWDKLRPRPSVDADSDVATGGFGGRSTVASVVFVALLSALSAIGWQLEVNLPYTHVVYRVVGQREPFDGIYFGETDGAFYIAPRPGANPDAPFFRAISVYPADHIYGLAVRPEQQTLCTRVNRPLVVVKNGAVTLWNTLKQHLRRTGQPVRTSASRSPSRARQHPTAGFCPPLP